jgi:hypothetical protein
MLEDSMILDIDVSQTPDGKIRLKYVAIAGGCGPEITMERSLAQETVDALRKVLDMEHAPIV